MSATNERDDRRSELEKTLGDELQEVQLVEYLLSHDATDLEYNDKLQSWKKIQAQKLEQQKKTEEIIRLILKGESTDEIHSTLDVSRDRIKEILESLEHPVESGIGGELTVLQKAQYEIFKEDFLSLIKYPPIMALILKDNVHPCASLDLRDLEQIFRESQASQLTKDYRAKLEEGNTQPIDGNINYSEVYVLELPKGKIVLKLREVRINQYNADHIGATGQSLYNLLDGQEDFFFKEGKLEDYSPVYQINFTLNRYLENVSKASPFNFRIMGIQDPPKEWLDLMILVKMIIGDTGSVSDNSSLMMLDTLFNPGMEFDSRLDILTSHFGVDLPEDMKETLKEFLAVQKTLYETSDRLFRSDAMAVAGKNLSFLKKMCDQLNTLYWSGMNPKEIAKRSGLTPEQVQDFLKYALTF